MNKGTSNKKAHITGERNLTNVDGDVFSPDRKSNINYSKSEVSTSSFLFGMTVLVLLIGELLFGWYLLNEFKIYKSVTQIERDDFKLYVEKRLDSNLDLINQFNLTYGEK